MTKRKRSVLLGVLGACVLAGCNIQLANGGGDAGLEPMPPPVDEPNDGGVAPTTDGGPKPKPDASACKPDPANFDIPGNGCDDDGDGKVDNATSCDDALAADGTADDFAKAIGLCQKATEAKWGVVSATYTRGYQSAQAPDPGQHGILPKFGNVVKPREGKRLGVLSSGYAREYNALDGATSTFASSKAFTSGEKAPPGFPKNTAACGTSSTVKDVATVKLQIKVPANIRGLSFNFNFWSSEWPDYVCTNFNDAFIAYLTSKAHKGGVSDNISFDPKGNPVSVNNNFFDRCTQGVQCDAKPASACAGGPNELAGTGFGDALREHCNSPNVTPGGATGWLSTKAPVQPGETITLEFMIWDTGDSKWDSSVLVDNFKWELEGEGGGDIDVGTTRPAD